ncbi:MAG TPA: alpha/beta hydrolase [Candidatus Acidoferrales bacterium]|nr:alpha/beta hydrolase [Candidatus Acidoferrales bacterium]
MAVAIIDELEVYYETRGTGAPLLMFAPGGFDATIDKWSNATAWKGADAVAKLAAEFQLILYDRRESGRSGGRVEKLTWDLYARQGRRLLEHLKIDSAFVLGGCMGCSVASAFAVSFPEAVRALLLHWPVGGYRWKAAGKDRFSRHARLAREQGLSAVIERAREKKNFWQDPESGPWASCIARDEKFAAEFGAQDPDRYLGLIETSARVLFDRDTAPGAEPEELLGIKAPTLIIAGDDPSHATSAAYYLEELIPNAELWDVMPPEQTTEKVCDRILDFCRGE